MAWQEENNTLTQEFEWENFREAMFFVNKVAEVAERLEHHPDIFVHNYNKVKITLTTHDSDNTITEKDREVAKEIDNLLK